MLEALIAQLETIEDPRCEWKVEHRLLDILVIAVCAVLGEAESFEDVAPYGRCKREWLERFLALPNGIPSHDTFRRVLMLVDPDAFERSFLGWVRAVFRPGEDGPRQVAIDGKTVRRSFDRKHGRSPLHLVSAYATEGGIVLAQRAAETKGGELAALPELLGGLDLAGCLVSGTRAPASPGSPSASSAAVGTTCWPSRATARRPTRRYGTGSRPTPSRSAGRSAPSSTRSTTATAAWCAGGCSPALTSASSPRSRTGRACGRCWRSRPSAASPAGARSRPRSATTCRARHSRRRRWRPPSEPTGGWRTGCTGSSTSASARTRAESASATRPGTWGSCA